VLQHARDEETDLDVVQLRLGLHFPLFVLCNRHLLHRGDAGAGELLIDDMWLGELKWVRHRAEGVCCGDSRDLPSLAPGCSDRSSRTMCGTRPQILAALPWACLAHSTPGS
jgi:hypothetical protein